MLRKIRIILGAVFFILITLLFVDFTGTMHHYVAWMAKLQFVPALLSINLLVIAFLLILTLVFGRVYCSIICPMGVFQDVIARLRRKKNKYSFSKAIHWLRYTMLGIFVIALLAGIPAIFGILSPYSSYGRIAQNLFQPIYQWGNNLLASVAESMDSYAFYHTDIWIRSLPIFIVALLTFVVIFVLAWRNGRTYCNTICPVGTILGFFSRFAWLKIHFDESKCRNCSLCSKNCKSSCIDYQTHTVDYSRCVSCGNCIEKCKFGALSYSHKSTATTEQPTPDKGKRSFLLASTMVATAALAQEGKKVDGGLAVIEDKIAPARLTPITPPGSLSARNMAKHCTGCQLCVSECPNNVLRPSTNFSTFMQPTSSYERGYCRPECNRCSEICPTGAIRPISLDEKSSIQVGHAVWVKKYCIPVSEGINCGNCARHCPVGAIEMVPLDPDDETSALVPAVNETRCIGCGACENLCPARPFSAIYVEGHEEHRMV
ncbi:MAG: 4Fe-4S binding protein [Prevotella sp.]|nr:4Fe-4S binding protein [Prevotella sp.]MBR5062273.1 4Fe-4S binding protein [Prevotella sp.]